MKKTMFLFFFIFIFFTKGVSGEVTNAEYYFVVQENGNAIVGINLYGSGEIIIPLPEDVENVYVKGGLYIMDNKSIDIAIGSSESAAVIYQTALLTKKTEDNWIFSANLDSTANKTIMVAIPFNAIIKDSNPSASIESGEFTKLYWSDVSPTNTVSFNYSFPVAIDPPSDNNDQDTLDIEDLDIRDSIPKYGLNISDEINSDNPQNILDLNPKKEENEVMLVISNKNKKNSSLFNYYFIIILVFLTALLSFLLYYKNSKKRKISGRQTQLLQTLTDNESNIVNLLIGEKDSLKRSFIEKKLEIAKSSLAATLNNLERKKIIELDRTYNSHRIKLADWFIKL